LAQKASKQTPDLAPGTIERRPRLDDMIRPCAFQCVRNLKCDDATEFRFRHARTRKDAEPLTQVLAVIEPLQDAWHYALALADPDFDIRAARRDL